jgi:hypothetical protein
VPQIAFSTYFTSLNVASEKQGMDTLLFEKLERGMRVHASDEGSVTVTNFQQIIGYLVPGDYAVVTNLARLARMWPLESSVAVVEEFGWSEDCCEPGPSNGDVVVLVQTKKQWRFGGVSDHLVIVRRKEFEFDYEEYIRSQVSLEWMEAHKSEIKDVQSKGKGD